MQSQPHSFENFDDAVFEKDLRHIHNTLINLSDVPVEEFLTTMNNSFQSLIDHHAPFCTHIFYPSSHSHHKLSTDAIAAKRKRRKLEGKISLLLRSSKPVPARLLAALKESRKTAHALIFKSRADFNNMLASVKPNSKVFWKTANSILHRSPPSPPRSSSEAINLVNTFSSFFKERIALIHKFLPTSISRCTDPILPDNQTPVSYFSFVSIEEVSRLIHSLPNKSSLDLIPTFTLKCFSHLFAPIISKLTNLSFPQAVLPAFFKTAQVLPLLKKGNLDPTIPSNYRPFSNLSTISKIIKRLVYSRITSHVSSSPNFNPFQSAYRKYHSTETTFLRITDSLRNICATGHTAVLVSLDLSAAFDTLDHNILINILNRHFNISKLALS